MSNPREVVARLVERGLMPASSVLDGDLTIHDASRRNHNTRIRSAAGPSFFVKHADRPGAPEALGREALLYSILLDPAHGFARHVPASYGYDVKGGFLAVELLADARSLREHHQRVGGFPPGIGAAMADVLARLHGIPVTDDLRRRTPPTAPPLQALLVPGAAGGDFGRGGARVLDLMREFPDLGRRVETAFSSWRMEALVHVDVKWDNWILAGADGPEPTLHLADWEMGGLGDPDWDVGSVFNDYLGAWVLSMPVVRDVNPAQLPLLAASPLDAMMPAMRAFWRAYADAMALTPAQRHARLERATRYAGARLVQTAFELTQGSNDLNANAVLVLQLAQNLMDRPAEGAEHLFGIGPQEVLA